MHRHREGFSQDTQKSFGLVLGYTEAIKYGAFSPLEKVSLYGTVRYPLEAELSPQRGTKVVTSECGQSPESRQIRPGLPDPGGSG